MQCRHYHAAIDEIAASKGVSREMCKRALIAWFRAESEEPVPALSREWDKRTASAFTDWVYAWQADAQQK